MIKLKNLTVDNAKKVKLFYHKLKKKDIEMRR